MTLVFILQCIGWRYLLLLSLLSNSWNKAFSFCSFLYRMLRSVLIICVVSSILIGTFSKWYCLLISDQTLINAILNMIWERHDVKPSITSCLEHIFVSQVLPSEYFFENLFSVTLTEWTELWRFNNINLFIFVTNSFCALCFDIQIIDLTRWTILCRFHVPIESVKFARLPPCNGIPSMTTLLEYVWRSLRIQVNFMSVHRLCIFFLFVGVAAF